ncbi:hypothetical protein [Duncaniella freteri]
MHIERLGTTDSLAVYLDGARSHETDWVIFFEDRVQAIHMT